MSSTHIKDVANGATRQSNEGTPFRITPSHIHPNSNNMCRTTNRYHQFPPFEILRECAQCSMQCAAFFTLGSTIGCQSGGWTCVCDNFGTAESAVSEQAFLGCSNTADVASATSVLSEFCAQYPGTTNLATATATQDSGSDATAGQTVVVPGSSDAASSTGKSFVLWKPEFRRRWSFSKRYYSAGDGPWYWYTDTNPYGYHVYDNGRVEMVKTGSHGRQRRCGDMN